MSLVVLGANVSPFVRKVRVALAEKGLDYELEPVNPFSPPEGWNEISPLKKIPAFRDDDFVVNDSSVICAYLERRFPKPALYPSDPRDYARAAWLEEYVDGGVVPVAGPKVFLPLVLRPLLSQKDPDAETEEAARKCAAEEMPVFWEYLERQLGDNEFFVAGRLSIADIAVASGHVNLRHAGVAPERRRWPKLRAFLDRMHGRPSFKAVIEEESPIFGRRASRIAD